MSNIYKSPGVYVTEIDKDIWLPVTFTRKYKINKIFNLGRDVYQDSVFHSHHHNSPYRKLFKIPVGGPTNKPKLIETINDFRKSFIEKLI